MGCHSSDGMDGTENKATHVCNYYDYAVFIAVIISLERYEAFIVPILYRMFEKYIYETVIAVYFTLRRYRKLFYTIPFAYNIIIYLIRIIYNIIDKIEISDDNYYM